MASPFSKYLFNYFTPVFCFFWLLGANITSILFPSILGMPSNAPTSFNLSANFNNSNSPLSLNIIARPLNCTCAFTLLPSCKNFSACLHLNSKSWSSVLGVNLTSFTSLVLDFAFKCKHAEKFLQDGNKVKAHVQFKGRAIMFKERGELLLLKFADRLKEVGALEGMPKMEGKRMLVMFAPKSQKKQKTGVK